MGDRGVAPVIDLGQARRRRGAQIGRGQAYRANPGLRPPRWVMVVDWEAMGNLSRSEIVAVERGGRRPPLKAKRLRRSGTAVARRALPLSRAQRRLAWKIERRDSGVAWAESRAARGELAPVIPFGHRGLHRRLRVPVGVVAAGTNLLDDAA
jgi:hypothetical protein